MDCDLKSFCSYLDELLLPESFQDVSINGLQVEGKNKISTVATAVTASLAAIKQAVDLHADVLLVHHGLFLKGKDICPVGILREKLKLLLENDISLVAYHLPLDAHPDFGNNWSVAKALGWRNIEPFGEYNGSYIGVKGAFHRCHRDEFQRQLEDFYGHTAHVAFGGKEEVASCALISGGAHKKITEAIEAEVDCFITGSFDEPIWHTAFEERINFMAFGHAATEKIGVQKLGQHLHQRFHISHVFIDEPNPF